MPPVTLVVGLLALPFVPLFARHAVGVDGEDWLWVVGLGGLVVSGALRGVSRIPLLPDAVRRAVFVLLGLLWGRFWVFDMQEAQFAWTLLLAPAGAVVAGTAGRRHVGLGAVVGLTAVWALMVPRAHNGCTGVSGYYGSVLVGHLVAMWAGPWLFSEPSRGRHES